MKVFNSPKTKLPKKGTSMIVWKKILCPTGKTELLCKLRIPARARRVEPLDKVQHGRTKGKCRAEWAIVVSIESETGNQVKAGISFFDVSFEYEVGKKVVPRNFNKSERLECASGINFFKTKEEARNYIF